MESSQLFHMIAVLQVLELSSSGLFLPGSMFPWAPKAALRHHLYIKSENILIFEKKIPELEDPKGL